MHLNELFREVVGKGDASLRLRLERSGFQKKTAQVDEDRIRIPSDIPTTDLLAILGYSKDLDVAHTSYTIPTGKKQEVELFYIQHPQGTVDDIVEIKFPKENQNMLLCTHLLLNTQQTQEETEPRQMYISDGSRYYISQSDLIGLIDSLRSRIDREERSNSTPDYSFYSFLHLLEDTQTDLIRELMDNVYGVKSRHPRSLLHWTKRPKELCTLEEQLRAVERVSEIGERKELKKIQGLLKYKKNDPSKTIRPIMYHENTPGGYEYTLELDFYNAKGALRDALDYSEDIRSPDGLIMPFLKKEWDTSFILKDNQAYQRISSAITKMESRIYR